MGKQARASSGARRPDRCNALAREALSEHGQSALGFRPRGLILDDVPVLDENSAMVGAAIVVIGLTLSLCDWTPLALLSYVMNSVRSARNPTGSLSVEVRSDPPDAQPVETSTRGSGDANSVASGSGDWPSYNRTVTSKRFSPLSEINTQTVGSLKILCSYDTKLRETFQTGLIVVNGALIGTTALDIFSIDPANCHENWRVHEEYKPAGQKVNRGAAYLDGRVFRGFLDGQVRAYDFKSGIQLKCPQGNINLHNILLRALYDEMYFGNRTVDATCRYRAGSLVAEDIRDIDELQASLAGECSKGLCERQECRR